MIDKELDKINGRHWKYNSQDNREFYVDHRLLTNAVFGEAGGQVPFKELIDDPTIKGKERERFRKLATKADDLREMLTQGQFGNPPNFNPYYDNSIAGRGNESLLDSATYQELRKAQEIYDEDAKVLKSRLKSAGQSVIDPDRPYRQHAWFEKR